MNQTKSDMQGRPSRIDAPKGHTPPGTIRPTPPAKIPKHRKRTRKQTLISQISYIESLPKDQRGRLVVDDWPFDFAPPDFVEIRKLPKNSILPQPEKAAPTQGATPKPKRPKIKDRIMNAIMQRLWTFVRDVLLQWVFPFPIYRKQPDGITPVTDADGKPVIDWFATVSARVLSLVAVMWGTVEVLGIPLSEWVARIGAALGIGG